MHRGYAARFHTLATKLEAWSSQIFRRLPSILISVAFLVGMSVADIRGWSMADEFGGRAERRVFGLLPEPYALIKRLQRRFSAAFRSIFSSGGCYAKV